MAAATDGTEWGSKHRHRPEGVDGERILMIVLMGRSPVSRVSARPSLERYEWVNRCSVGVRGCAARLIIRGDLEFNSPLGGGDGDELLVFGGFARTCRE